MIIITVTMISAMALTGAAISTSKQFTKTDNRNVATDLAEMGIIYYHNSINNIINTANPEIDFCSKFKEVESANPSIYQVKSVDTNQYQIRKTSPINCANTSEFIIKFTSTGTTANGETKTLDGELIISSAGARVGELLDNITSNNTAVGGEVTVNDNKNVVTYSAQDYGNGVSFSATLTVTGGQTKLVIERDAYFQELILQGGAQVEVKDDAVINLIEKMNGQTGITIFKDAIFVTDTTPFDKDPTKKATICIHGDIYKVSPNADPKTLRPFSDFSTYFTNTCSDPNKFLWSINPNEGVKVTY